MFAIADHCCRKCEHYGECNTGKARSPYFCAFSSDDPACLGMGCRPLRCFKKKPADDKDQVVMKPEDRK